MNKEGNRWMLFNANRTSGSFIETVVADAENDAILKAAAKGYATIAIHFEKTPDCLLSEARQQVTKGKSRTIDNALASLFWELDGRRSPRG